MTTLLHAKAVTCWDTWHVTAFFASFLLVHFVIFVLFYQFEHNLSPFRVKLGSKTFLDFLFHCFLRKQFTVAPVWRHSVIGICHCNDRRDLRDLFSLQSAGITFSIISFMVIFCPIDKFRGRFDLRKDLCPCKGMSFNDFKFFICQFPQIGRASCRERV